MRWPWSKPEESADFLADEADLAAEFDDDGEPFAWDEEA